MGVFLWLVQYRIDKLNNAFHRAGERTPAVRRLERSIQRFIGPRFALVYSDEIEEYGLFSANEPRRAAA